jgi:hypothetical protein
VKHACFEIHRSTGAACKKPRGCNAHPSYQTVKKLKEGHAELETFSMAFQRNIVKLSPKVVLVITLS